MKSSRNLMLVVGLVTLTGIALAVSQRHKTVRVVTPVSMHVAETIAASGRLRGETESSIGAPDGGRVAEIDAHEGDHVQAGQLLARMDAEVLAAQVEQARRAVETAQRQVAEATSAVKTASAQLQQAARPPLAADVERLRADTEQSIHVAQAKLNSAQQHRAAMYQRYLALKSGARPEQIAQARTQVRQAEESLAQLERERDRQQVLYGDHAVARVDAEHAATNYEMGRQTLLNAQARMEELQNGNRAEEVAQALADTQAASADVVAAEASLSGARRSGAAQMRSLLAQPRPEDVAVARERQQQEMRGEEVARQRLIEAQTALTLAERRYGETRIVAPYAGVVTQVVTEVGAIAGPNAPILRLVRAGRPEIHLDLDESNLGRLRVGQEALVTNDAFPDARFRARVSELGAQVDADRGTVEVKLIPIAPPNWVRPGQTFTVNIALPREREPLVVPVSAVNTVGGVSSLLIVEKGRIAKKSVQAGPMTLQGVPIYAGITPNTLVVIDPTGLQEGEAVVAGKAR